MAQTLSMSLYFESILYCSLPRMSQCFTNVRYRQFACGILDISSISLTIFFDVAIFSTFICHLAQAQMASRIGIGSFHKRRLAIFSPANSCPYACQFPFRNSVVTPFPISWNNTAAMAIFGSSPSYISLRIRV